VSEHITAKPRHGGKAPYFGGNQNMKSNTTTILLAVLCVAAGAAGYWFYQEQNRSGVEVNVGGRSLTIETR